MGELNVEEPHAGETTLPISFERKLEKELKPTQIEALDTLVA